MSDEFVKVGRIEDFPEGELERVQIAGQDVVVASLDGKIFAMQGSCTHKGAPLSEGELEGAIVVCPRHGGQFDIMTGRVISPPPVKDEATFEVQIRGSDVLLRKR